MEPVVDCASAGAETAAISMIQRNAAKIALAIRLGAVSCAIPRTSAPRPLLEQNSLFDISPPDFSASDYLRNLPLAIDFCHSTSTMPIAPGVEIIPFASGPAPE